MAGNKTKVEELILLKEESTEGSDASCAAADAALVHNFSLTLVKDNERIEGADTYAEIQEVVGGEVYWEFSYDFYLAGPGASKMTAGTAGKINRHFQMCGWEETLNAGTNQILTPLASPSSSPSFSIYRYLGGKLYKLLGSRASLKIAPSAVAKPWKGSVTGMAQFAAVTDAAFPSSPQFDGTTPPPWKGATLSYDSYSAIFQAIELDAVCTPEKNTDPGDTYGIDGFRHRNWEPGISLGFNDDAVADRNWVAKAITDGGKALSCAWGSAAGNTFSLSVPKVHEEGLEFGGEKTQQVTVSGVPVRDGSTRFATLTIT